MSSNPRLHSDEESSDKKTAVDTPHHQALVSRRVTVGTPTPRASGLSDMSSPVRREQNSEDLEELEAETSSLLQSRFRRPSPLSWRANEEVDLPEQSFQWQNSGGTFTSSIPVPTAIRHTDRQFSIESLLSIGSFDSITQALGNTPARRGSLHSSSTLDGAIDDLCQQNLGFHGLRPLGLGRQSSLASLGGGASPFGEVAELRPSLAASSGPSVESPVPLEEASIPIDNRQRGANNQSSLSEETTPQAKTSREKKLQNAARVAAGLPPLPFGHYSEDFSPRGPGSKFTTDFWNAAQKPSIVDRVSSANANWEMYGYNPAAVGPAGSSTPAEHPARPSHLKTRGRSRSNVTFSDPPAVEMQENSSKPGATAAAAANTSPAPAKIVRKQSEGAHPMFPAVASNDWSQTATSTPSTSPGTIRELPSSALQEWLSGTPNGPNKDQASPMNNMSMPPGMFAAAAPWGQGMYGAPPGAGYDPEMFPPYGPPTMMPPHMAHGNFPYGMPVPMMWSPPYDRSSCSNRGRGPGQGPKRYVSAGPYSPFPGQAGFNAFPPAYPYKRSASAPEGSGNMDFAQKWAKTGDNNNNKSPPARVKRERSAREGSDRKKKLVQFGHPHAEVMEGRRIYSRHTLFLLGAHRSDILPVNGNNVDGCDSLLLCNNVETPQRKDDLAMLKYACSSRSGGAALFASHIKNSPVRVFRKHENGKTQGFRYDGLYAVIAMFDDSGSPRSELPAMAHERVEFLLRRNPYLNPKEANAIALESSSAFRNRLSIDELWEHVSRTLTGGRELNKGSTTFSGGSSKVYPEQCDSSSSSKRPHSSLHKSKSESHSPSPRPSRPAALNTRPRATSAEVALLHIRYFATEDDEEDESSTSRGQHEAGHDTAEHTMPSSSSKRQKQSHHKSGELSPEMISDAIGRLLHPDGPNNGMCTETSIQKTTVALPPDGMGRGLF